MDVSRDARIEAAVAAYAAGEKVEVIKATHQINAWTMMKAVDAAGVPRRGHGFWALRAPRLRELVAAGNTDLAIAREFGCTELSIRNARHRFGIPRNRRRRAAAAENVA